jgi:hypothetical protein
MPNHHHHHHHQEQAQHVSKKTDYVETIVSWVAVAIAIAVAVILDNRRLPQKWHAAVMLTYTAFVFYVLLSRRARFIGVRVDYGHRKLSRDGWRRWRFWVISIIVMALHVLFIYILFAVVLARVTVLGMIYVYPLGLAEGVLLTAVVGRIERATTPWLHDKSMTGPIDG